MTDPLTIVINVIAVAVSLYQLAWLRSLQQSKVVLSKWQDAQEAINRETAKAVGGIETVLKNEVTARELAENFLRSEKPKPVKSKGKGRAK